MRPGHLIAGKYRLECWLGGGGMGQVWRARHVELGRRVAVKLLASSQRDPWALRRFKTEARVAAELKSPHVVDVRDCGVDRGVPYIVMELLEGESLSSRLARRPGVTFGELAHWVDQAALALELAHGRNLVHRDIKPSNLFLSIEGGEWTLKVLDFGIVKSLTEPMASESTLVGSPGYLSPEQARGERIDRTTDLWALGAIVYRVTTGVEPFWAPSLAEAIERVCVRPIPAPSQLHPDLPRGLDEFIERALSRDRARRFCSAPELARALAEIARGHERLVLPSAPDTSPGDSSAELAPRVDSTRFWSASNRPISPGTRWYPALGVAAATAVLATLAVAAREPARAPGLTARTSELTARSPPRMPTRTAPTPIPSSPPHAVPEAAPLSAGIAPVTSTTATQWTAAAAHSRVRPRTAPVASAPMTPAPVASVPPWDSIFGLPLKESDHARLPSDHDTSAVRSD